MDAAVVRQFLDFFQDFLHLCQMENWPDDSTTESEIKKAFLAAVHVEKCLNKLQKKDLISEFLSTFNSSQETSKTFLRNSFADPPKYILKKVINSNAKITQMEVGFKVFLELFNEEKLEQYLADIMLEVASQETLLRNLTTEISKENLLSFKSQVLLSELNTADSTDSLLELLQNPTQDAIELLVVSLLNKDFKYSNAVKSVLKAFKQIMLSKNSRDKLFWTCFFKIKDDYLINICLNYSEIFKLIVSALLDSGKLLREQMSADFFYIDLTYSQLVNIVQTICENENLKLEFFDLVTESEVSLTFWQNMVSG